MESFIYRFVLKLIYLFKQLIWKRKSDRCSINDANPFATSLTSARVMVIKRPPMSKTPRWLHFGAAVIFFRHFC